MHRFRILSDAVLVSAVMTLLLLAAAAPATGGTPPAEPHAVLSMAALSGPAQVACATSAPDLAALVASDAGVCRVDSAEDDSPSSTRFGARTCRCSCGYPCKTDADCGGGIGSCRAGISCC